MNLDTITDFRRFQLHWTRLFAFAMDGNDDQYKIYPKTHQISEPFLFSIDQWRAYLYATYLYPYYGQVCDRYKVQILDEMNHLSAGALTLAPKFYEIDHSIHITDYDVSHGELNTRSEEHLLALLEMTMLMHFKKLDVSDCLFTSNGMQSPYLLDFMSKNPDFVSGLNDHLPLFNLYVAHLLDHVVNECIDHDRLLSIQEFDRFLSVFCGVADIRFVCQELCDTTSDEEDEEDEEDEDEDEDEDDFDEKDFPEVSAFEFIQDHITVDLVIGELKKEEGYLQPEESINTNNYPELPDISVENNVIDTETTDDLGHYLQQQNHIRLYAFKISQSIAHTNQKHDVAFSDDVQTLEVYTHELAHLMTHRSNTVTGKSWTWIEQSIQPIIEGIAQYFTYITTQLLDNQDVFKLHCLITPAMPRSYRVHLLWLENQHEVIRGFVQYVDEYESRLSALFNKQCGANLHFYQFQSEYLHQKNQRELCIKGKKHKMIYCPAGEVPLRYRDDVDSDGKVDKDFWIFDAPITQELWFDVMKYQPSLFLGPNTIQHPVENITMIEAMHFCNQLSINEGLTPYYHITENYLSTHNWLKMSIRHRIQHRNLLFQEVALNLKELKFHPYRWGCFMENVYHIYKFQDTRDYYRLYYIVTNETSDGYRLPNYHQWLYAACADGKFMTREINQKNDIRYRSQFRTHPIKQKKQNLWGIYEMSTSVSECLYVDSSSYDSSPGDALIPWTQDDYIDHRYHSFRGRYIILKGLRPIKPTKTSKSLQ